MDKNLRKLLNRAPATLAALLMMGAVAMAATAPAASPRALIDGFHATLLNVMKEARTLGPQGRFARIEPEVAQRFDIPLMIALATGSHWRSASPADRQRLEKAFRNFSAANYAAQFSDFSGESFETIGVQAGPRNTQLVRTLLHRPADKPVAITYVTRATDKTWRIVDLLVDDGISELAVRRSEYSSILKSGGVDGLVRVLESKTAQLLNE
jgi:phospholipid transport system substrate-binding protein